MNRNPYLVGLAVVGFGLLVIALGAWVFSLMSPYSVRPGMTLFAAGAAGLAGPVLLGWTVASAIVWKPTTKSSTQAQ
jgi:hypothetical protein